MRLGTWRCHWPVVLHAAVCGAHNASFNTPGTNQQHALAALSAVQLSSLQREGATTTSLQEVTTQILLQQRRTPVGDTRPPSPSSRALFATISTVTTGNSISEAEGPTRPAALRGTTPVLRRRKKGKSQLCNPLRLLTDSDHTCEIGWDTVTSTIHVTA